MVFVLVLSAGGYPGTAGSGASLHRRVTLTPLLDAPTAPARAPAAPERELSELRSSVSLDCPATPLTGVVACGTRSGSTPREGAFLRGLATTPGVEENGTVIASPNGGDQPEGVALDPTLAQVYVADIQTNELTVLSAANNSDVGTIPLPDPASGVATDPLTGAVYAASLTPGNVWAYSPSGGGVQSLGVLTNCPFALADDPSSSTLFAAGACATNGVSNVTALSTSQDRILREISLAMFPMGLLFDATDNTLYVSLDSSSSGLGNVTAVDASSGQVLKVIPVGGSPSYLALGPGGTLFVANDNGYLSEIATATGQILANLSLPLPPGPIAFDNGNGLLYVAFPRYVGSVDVDSQIVAYRLSPFGPVTSLTGGVEPVGLTYDPSNGELFAANAYSDNVTVLSTLLELGNLSLDPRGNLPGALDLGEQVELSAPVVGEGSGADRGTLAVSPGGGLRCSGVSTSPLLVNASCGLDRVGNYTLWLNLTDSRARTVSSWATLEVLPDPAAQVVASRPSADSGQSVTFQAQASGGTGDYPSYAWSGLPAGCTGTTSSSVTCPIAVSTPSDLVVSVAITDSNNVSSGPSLPLLFPVYPDPQISAIGASQPGADAGQTVTFFASVLGGSGNAVFAWSGLPSVGCQNGTSASVRCTFSAPANLSLEVSARDSNGVPTPASPWFNYSVVRALSVAISPAGLVSADLGERVSLQAETQGGAGNLSYTWSDLPAGCTGVGTASLTCLPPGPGTYPIALAVTDRNGETAYAPGVVLVVNAPLTVNPSATVGTPSPGEPVGFEPGQAGGTAPFSYAWRFGDGTNSSEAFPTHVYRHPGTYTVGLWVNDSAGRGAVGQLTVVVTGTGTPVGGSAAPAALPGWVPWTLGGLSGATVLLAALLAFVLSRRKR